MEHTVTLIPGDGVGPELTEAARRVVDATGVRISWEIENAGANGVAQYPDIAFEDRIVDNMATQLVQKPEQYDVLVTLNLYGDILSDLGAGLIGGLGVAPGANLGDEVAIFEAVHGSAPKYAGLNKMDPTALMLSAVMMLRHLGEPRAADRMETAIAAVIAEGTCVTYDLKPEPNDPTAVGTSQMADCVIAHLP